MSINELRRSADYWQLVTGLRLIILSLVCFGVGILGFGWLLHLMIPGVVLALGGFGTAAVGLVLTGAARIELYRHYRNGRPAGFATMLVRDLPIRRR